MEKVRLRLMNLETLRTAFALVACWIFLSGVQGQQNIQLTGVMPTVDVGLSLGENWYFENYSFACVLPFEQSRPSFSQIQAMDVYGPGAEQGEFRGVRALVFAYTEFDLTRTLNEAWSVTGSYTHEWVPKMSNRVWVPQRYTRDEHRTWLQVRRVQRGERMEWWLRTRWDQRLIENDPFGVDQDEWSWRPRARQQFGASWPVGGAVLTASAEVFLEAWAGANISKGADRFRESWTSLQCSRQVNDRVKWEAGPLVVSWKQFDANGSLGWTHYWYLQTTAFFDLTRSE
ncbi:MAG: hypothetical protein ISQ97_06685 [Flavobacteriales bacterium]|nr:hypothetical protein [Flavobacteriales bacterium]